MPLERLLDPPEFEGGYWNHRPCAHPEHNPPSMIVLEPGRYRHMCPGCNRAIVFTVQRPYWSAGSSGTISWAECGNDSNRETL